MSINNKTREQLQNLIKDIAKQYVTATETAVTDIHINVSSKDGLLTVFDDDDRVIAQTHVAEWDDTDDERRYENIEICLRGIISYAEKEGVLDSMNINKPYSYLLVDDDKETIVDLIYIDDETYIISNELLKGLDEELNDFLKHLLEE